MVCVKNRLKQWVRQTVITVSVWDVDTERKCAPWSTGLGRGRAGRIAVASTAASWDDSILHVVEDVVSHTGCSIVPVPVLQVPIAHG